MITWTCEICGKPIEDKTGYLEVRDPDINQCEQQTRQWKADNPGPVIRADAYLSFPPLARWHCWHHHCDPHRDRSDGYLIEVERIRTHVEVIDWTAHLMDKRWLEHTDWQRVLRDSIGARP